MRLLKGEVNVILNVYIHECMRKMLLTDKSKVLDDSKSKNFKRLSRGKYRQEECNFERQKSFITLLLAQ